LWKDKGPFRTGPNENGRPGAAGSAGRRRGLQRERAVQSATGSPVSWPRSRVGQKGVEYVGFCHY
jgi:hypothetical protein